MLQPLPPALVPPWALQCETPARMQDVNRAREGMDVNPSTIQKLDLSIEICDKVVAGAASSKVYCFLPPGCAAEKNLLAVPNTGPAAVATRSRACSGSVWHWEPAREVEFWERVGGTCAC